tara:strand:- start:5276 stop:7075 length:1800 start_codon:yes stop_codon:yes gene_type:complete
MALTSPLLSPGIAIREFDITGVAPNVETSLAGFVGAFKWGPVDVPVRVQNEAELSATFGTPDTERAVDYFSCTQFLRYSGNLIVNRAIPTGVISNGDSALNASNNQDGSIKIQVLNEGNWEQQETSILNSFTAKYPGEIGSSLAVSIFHGSEGDTAANVDSDFQDWTYGIKFDGPTGTSEWLENQIGTNSNDEVHIAVIDSDGLFSGTKGTVLETFSYLSVAPSAKTMDGGDNYVKTVLNAASEFVWFKDWSDGQLPSNSTTWDTNPPSDGSGVDYSEGVTWTNATSSSSLSSGQDGGALDAGDYTEAFGAFSDTEEVDIQLLIAPGMNTAAAQVGVVNMLVGIAGNIRKDALVCASPNRAAVVNQNSPVTETLATTDLYTASSYLAVDNNYLRVYDKYNDVYIYIPAASSTAGIMAFCDYNFGPWYSPAGEKRGEYVGVTNLAYSPTKAQRDELYKKGVNPIVQFPGRGTLLFGDKTKLSRPSAFDRINVRRLFLAVEKSVAIAARNFLFEFNDEFTRSEFVAVVEPLLREIQGRRGIIDFKVQCDETNNTAEVIDRNELRAAIFIKPARSINFITIDFVATRTGADFNEIVSSDIPQ